MYIYIHRKILNINIQIEDFSVGKECVVFSDIQLERQERDERHLIKVLENIIINQILLFI